MPSMHLNVDLVCDIFSPSGYSNHAREIINALIDDPEIGLKLVESKHDSQTVALPKDVFDKYIELKSKQHHPDVVIQFETPEFFEPRTNCLNIGFTQWETNRIPDTDFNGDARLNWVKQMNRMGRMMSSSRSALAAFHISGVTTPSFYVPGPIDVDSYDLDKLQELPIAHISVDDRGNAISKEDRPPVFACVGQWNARKNIEDLIVTVLSFFKRGDFILLIKTYGSTMSSEQNNACINSIQRLKEIVKNPNAPEIVVVTENLSDQNMKRLFKSVDYYINPSRGEGFCMPLAQAMAAGIPVISTDVTAPLDYVEHEATGLLVPTSMEPAIHMPNNPWYRYNQLWGRFNMEAMASDIARCANGLFSPDRKKIRERAEHYFGRRTFLRHFKQAIVP